MFKIYIVKRRENIDGMSLYPNDIKCYDTTKNRWYVVSADNLRRINKNYHYLWMAYTCIHKNHATGEKSVLWVHDTIKRSEMTDACIDLYREKVQMAKFAAVEYCQKNDKVRRKKCRPLVKPREKFDGMVKLSYGEQCIARTFTGRKNLSYNADLA